MTHVFNPSTPLERQVPLKPDRLSDPFCIHEIHREHFAGAWQTMVCWSKKETRLRHVPFLVLPGISVYPGILVPEKNHLNPESSNIPIGRPQPRALVKVRQPAANALRMQQILGVLTIGLI